MIGTAFVIRPSFIFGGDTSINSNHLFGTLLAIFAALFNSCAVISIKILGEDSSVFEQMFYFCIINSILSPLLLLSQA